MSAKITLGLIGLSILGWYLYQEATNPSPEEIRQAVTADTQAIEAYKKAHPAFDSDNMNTQMRDLNFSQHDTATNGNYVATDHSQQKTGEYKYQPAVMIGNNAGFTSIDWEDPLIGQRNTQRNTTITAPQRIPGRYRDSSGR